MRELEIVQILFALFERSSNTFERFSQFPAIHPHLASTLKVGTFALR
jgi:hypothetical protein